MLYPNSNALMRGPRLKTFSLSDICDGEDMEACLGRQIQEAFYGLGQQLEEQTPECAQL